MNHVATKAGATITSFDKEIAVAQKSLITWTSLINKHESSFLLFFDRMWEWGFKLELENK